MKSEVKNRVEVDQEVQDQSKKIVQKENKLTHQNHQIKKIIKENPDKILQNLLKEKQAQIKERLLNPIEMDIIHSE